MNYEVVRNKESRHRWKDQSRRVWYYIHWKEAEKMQIDLAKVFADIGNEKENNGSDLNSNGRILLLQDKKEQLASSETVLGYIPCREKKEAESDLVLPVVPSAFVDRWRDMVVIEPEAKGGSG